MFKNPKEIFCPKCNKYIPTESAVCPKCGFEITEELRKKAIKSTARINILSAVILAFLILGGINYCTKDNDKTEEQQSVQTAENGEYTITVTDSDNAVQQAVPYTVLPYSVYTFETGLKNGRAWASYKIILKENGNAKINAQNLIATAASAAKYLAAAENRKIVQIVMYDQAGSDWGQTQLARITYAPDGKGFGYDNWQWFDYFAAERTTTAEEKAVSKAWNAMRKNFQTANGTDEDALTAAIAKKLNIPAEKVNLPYLILDKTKIDFSKIKVQSPQ